MEKLYKNSPNILTGFPDIVLIGKNREKAGKMFRKQLNQIHKIIDSMC